MKQETARRSLWTPSTFVTATSALVAETAVAAVVLILWAPAQPVSPSEDDSGALGIVFLPFFLALWTLVSAALAAALVIPTAALARRTAAPLPVLALPVAAAAVLAALVVSGHPGALAGHPAACLYGWLGVTAAIVPAALLTLVADRRAATARNPWGLPLWLLGGSCLVPVAGLVLVVVGVLVHRAVMN
ncbi:hypothetical protein [Streptomyces roseoverticillatus]|uniref:hypothetical protein n=1 Tax=Streptomyces roseoverticillatus TaxID=66429 RepID=UPI0004BFF31A|nr:hypothetical protein [Streptomyces roseoverticillatus]